MGRGRAEGQSGVTWKERFSRQKHWIGTMAEEETEVVNMASASGHSALTCHPGHGSCLGILVGLLVVYLEAGSCGKQPFER